MLATATRVPKRLTPRFTVMLGMLLLVASVDLSPS